MQFKFPRGSSGIEQKSFFVCDDGEDIDVEMMDVIKLQDQTGLL